MVFVVHVFDVNKTNSDPKTGWQVDLVYHRSSFGICEQQKQICAIYSTVEKARFYRNLRVSYLRRLTVGHECNEILSETQQNNDKTTNLN